MSAPNTNGMHQDAVPFVRNRTPATVTMAVVGLAFSMPFFLSLVLDAGFLDLANESLAYRFFYAERVQAGDHSVVVGVGYLASVLHHLVYFTLHLLPGFSSAALERRIDVFALATNGALSAALCAMLVVAARARRLEKSDLALLALVALLPVYGTQKMGFDYSLMADYHFVDIVLCVTSLLLFQLVWRRGDVPPSRGQVIALAAFVGVAAANKITMLTVAGVVLAPLIVSGGGLLAPIRRAALAALTMFLAFLVVHIVSYLGDLRAVARALKIWKHFVAAPGGEPAFWSELFGKTLHDYNYELILPFGLCVFVLAVASLRSARSLNPRGVFVMLFCAASIAANMMFVVKRPATSTLFESTMFIFTMSCVALTVASGWKPIRFAVAGICATGLVLAISTFSYQWCYAVVAESGPRSRVKWDAFDETMRASRGRPVEVVLPDNSYHHEGVFEFLVKGASDFPTWYSSKGRPLIDRYAPGMILRFDDGELKPNAPYEGGRTIVWFDRSDLDPAVVRYPELGKVVGRAGVTRREYAVQTKTGASTLRMHVAFVPDGD